LGGEFGEGENLEKGGICGEGNLESFALIYKAASSLGAVMDLSMLFNI